MGWSKAIVINGLWMIADGWRSRELGWFGGRDQPRWWFSASEADGFLPLGSGLLKSKT